MKPFEFFFLNSSLKLHLINMKRKQFMFWLTKGVIKHQ